MVKNGKITVFEKDKYLLPENLDANFEYHRPDKLTTEQENTWKSIRSHINRGKFSCHLIFGVTGSGKTEIYLKAIEETLNKGKSVIYLVPEISLTSNIAYILLSNFPDYEIGIYHSKIPQSLRYKLWENALNGNLKILVGARSGLFLPMKNLGLIIVDEEHENSYKQEDKPRYHGRDCAIMKGKFHNATVILGSGTPSVISYYNALKGKYHLHLLKERVNKLPLPDFNIIDLKKFSDKRIISPPLKEKIRDKINRNEQVILLINKKGYASYIICKDCGHVFKCKNCDITLTYYKSINRLICSICDNRFPIPAQCPVCKGNLFKFLGKGTEKIVEQTIKELDNIVVERFDAQSTSKKGKSRDILKKFNNGEVDVIVGTQMIAKGYDFKNVTLVGIITIDNMLNFPDYNSTEKTFQLIMQCSGRAGRKDKQGEVILQTFSPENYVFKFCRENRLKDFYDYELNQRKIAAYPPFSHLVHIILEGKDYEKLEKFSEKLTEFIFSIKPSSTYVLGPVPSQIKKIRNRFRFSILLKSKSRKSLNKLAFKVVKSFIKVSGIDIKVDVDPVNLF
jgi:primosomal protein N' (replication factor Y)